MPDVMDIGRKGGIYFKSQRFNGSEGFIIFQEDGMEFDQVACFNKGDTRKVSGAMFSTNQTQYHFS